jgi:serine/threonine protein phosphatase 1
MSFQEPLGDASAVALLGNHEELMLRAFTDPPAKAQWLANGGTETLESYSGADGQDAIDRHAKWMRSLPIYFDDGLRFFVHAGVDPARSLHNQSQHDLLWIREPFLNFDGAFERLIVHGHTPVRTGPEVSHNRVNVDTGAVFGGQLTAAVFDQDQREPLEFLSAAD